MLPEVVGEVSLVEYVVTVLAAGIGYSVYRILKILPYYISKDKESADFLSPFFPIIGLSPTIALSYFMLQFKFIEIGSLLPVIGYTVFSLPRYTDFVELKEADYTFNHPSIYKLALLLQIILLSAILRIFRLGDEAYYIDETITLWFAQNHSAIELLWVIPFTQPHLPLYYILIELWTTAFGYSEFVTRFPSVIFSILMVVAIYALGTRIYGSRVGLIASFLVAISPYQLIYAQWVRMYALLGLLSIIIFYYSNSVIEGRVNSLSRYIITAGLLGATHVYGLFVILATWIYLLLDVRLENKSRVGYSIFFSGLFSLPWVTILLVKLLFPKNNGMVEMGSVAGAFPSLPSNAFHLAPSLQWLFFGYLGGFLLSLATGLLAIGMIWGLHEKQKKLLLVWIFIPLAIALIISSFKPILQFKQLIIISPALYLLLAVGLSRQKKTIFVVFLTLLIVVSGIQIIGFYENDRYRPYDNAISDIKANFQEGDVILNPATRTTPYSFYLNESGLDYVYVYPGNRYKVKEIQANYSCIWFIYDWPGYEYGEQIASQLQETHTIAYNKSYSRMKDGFGGGIHIKRYIKNNSCR